MSWHNETLNIWTHLLLLLFCVFLAIYDLCIRADVTRWNVVVTLFSSIFTMALSVSYHSGMNRCQCQREYVDCMNLDVSGVIIGISSTALSPINFGYKCNYIVAVLSALIILAVLTISTLNKVIGNGVTAKIRGKYIGSLLLIRNLFVVLLVIGNAVYHQRYQNMLYHIMSVGFLFIGGVINVQRIPERFIKAQCIHYVGSSHQIFHCFTIVGFLATYYGAVWDAYYWQITECE